MHGDQPRLPHLPELPLRILSVHAEILANPKSLKSVALPPARTRVCRSASGRKIAIRQFPK